MRKNSATFNWGQYRQHGEIAKDNREFINAVVWILRTGAPWRDFPPDYGKFRDSALKIY